jgi:hypothetical protein
VELRRLIVRWNAGRPRRKDAHKRAQSFDNLDFPQMSDPNSTEQFNTWSEIAGYLGISIREAQYRAKNEGLPVRRGVGKKPRVWALRSELDAWRLKAGAGNAAPATNLATDQPPPDVASPHSVEESNTPTVRGGRRAILSAAGLAATAVAAKLIFGTRKPRVERAVLMGGLLTALDGLGRPIWEHRFLGDLQPRTDDLSWRVQVIDLEGSGSPSVLVVCSRVAQGTTEQTGIDELTCFTPDGHVKWNPLSGQATCKNRGANLPRHSVPRHTP